MDRKELLKILQNETDGFTEQSRLRDDVLDALEKVQELAINYSQCCTELCKVCNNDQVFETEDGYIADVSSSTDLKVGDKIDVGGFVTELKEIKYDPYARINFYWFYNERGEYKYNVLEWITKV